jgi:enoyl-CoA hydratase
MPEQPQADDDERTPSVRSGGHQASTSAHKEVGLTQGTHAGFSAEHEAGVLRVTFGRAEQLNALTTELMNAVAHTIRAAQGDPSIRVIVLAGEGRAFSAGADLDGAAEGTLDAAVLDAANSLVRAIVEAPVPVLAAVHGPAVGVGATIALSCDLVVAARRAYFLMAFVNIGLMPDGGATAIVPAAIGRARAARMTMLGERISSETAFEWGLVSHVVDDASFDEEVQRIVGVLAAGPTMAYARTKAALHAATLRSLENAHTVERAGQLELFDTADFAEGVAAFYGRRPPVFTGR